MGPSKTVNYNNSPIVIKEMNKVFTRIHRRD